MIFYCGFIEDFPLDKKQEEGTRLIPNEKNNIVVQYNNKIKQLNIELVKYTT